MVGAHTDSPCLRIKPVSKKQGDGFIQVGVETYGGGLWHTCTKSSQTFSDEAGADFGLGFDRDLSIAGRAIVKAENGDHIQKLIKINRPSIGPAAPSCYPLLLTWRCSSSHSHPCHPPRSPRDICVQQGDATVSNSRPYCCRT